MGRIENKETKVAVVRFDRGGGGGACYGFCSATGKSIPRRGVSVQREASKGCRRKERAKKEEENRRTGLYLSKQWQSIYPAVENQRASRMQTAHCLFPKLIGRVIVIVLPKTRRCRADVRDRREKRHTQSRGR